MDILKLVIVQLINILAVHVIPHFEILSDIMHKDIVFIMLMFSGVLLSHGLNAVLKIPFIFKTGGKQSYVNITQFDDTEFFEDIINYYI